MDTIPKTKVQKGINENIVVKAMLAANEIKAVSRMIEKNFRVCNMSGVSATSYGRALPLRNLNI